MIKRLFLLLVTTFLCSVSVQAQTTEGREFWLTFGQILGLSITPPNVNLFDMQIRIVGGNKATSVSIYFTDLNTYQNFDIQPYEIYNYTLENAEKYAVYNIISDGTTNYSIRVTTSNPVSVYASHRYMGSISFDVTNVFPVTALGTKYYVISYRALHENRDSYSVIATQNNTVLHRNGILVATLNAGQVYYRRSLDNTGDLITSNRPVALFAQNAGTSIPSGIVDILFQQLAPVHTWDKTFFVPATIVVALDRVRILASTNNTTITQTGGIPITDTGGQPSLTNLQAGQFVELEISSNTIGCFIEVNEPVGVCAFTRSNGNSNPTGSGSQTWVPGIKQTVPSILTAPFMPNGQTPLNSHYALIVTSTATRDNTLVSVGGAVPAPLSGGTWYTNVEAEMSFYNFQLTNLSAPYVFSNPEGIIVLGYGLGAIGAQAAGYYYLAGSAMRDLDAAFYANDIHFQELKVNPFCEGLVKFRAEINGLHQTASERIKWYVDGAMEPGTLNQETWQRNFTQGNYEIRMWVRYENEDTISKTGTLIIKSCNQSAAFYANNVHHSVLGDTTFCNKNVNFYAELDGYNSITDTLKWYINGIEEVSAQGQLQWNKPFENGTYEIKMVVSYNNGETATLTGTLKVQALWIKMRNVRY